MKLINYILIASSLLALTFSCQKSEDDFFGPELATASSGFELKDSLTISNQEIDFTKDSIVLVAKLSEKVNWKIKLKGKISGAIKEFEGLNDSVNVVWSGASDNIFHFRAKEQVSATLTILGSNVSDTVFTVIDKTKIFKGFLVNDFDGAGLTSGGWWNSFKPGELISFSNKYSDIKTPQGSNCIFMKGVDLGPDKFLGQTGHPGTYDYGEEEEFPEENERLYFNYYLSGTVGTRLEVRLLQTVNGAPDGDDYSHFINITWSGWRLISVPYSEFNRTAGDGSSPIKGAKKITRVKFVLRSVTNGGNAEAYIDYPIFTIDKPFEQ